MGRYISEIRKISVIVIIVFCFLVTGCSSSKYSSYESSDEGLNVQGGNINCTTIQWWGIRQHSSKTRTKTHINNLTTISAGFATTTAIGAILGVTGNVAGIIIGGISGSLCGWCRGWKSLLISKNTGSYGTISDLGWTGDITVRKQTSSTY